jgi:hypothetical protein
MLCLVLAACNGSDAAGADGEMEMDHSEMSDGEMTDGEMAGEDNMSETVQISLQAAPEGVAGEYLSVVLTDSAGEPVTDASVGLEGNMNHAGMVPVMADAVTDDADGAADGVYQVPFTFNMNGDWIITVVAELADGTTEMQDVNLTVTEESVEIES